MADAKRANGTIAADAQAVPISPNGRGCVAIELTGTWVINLDVKSLIDGTEENAKIYNAAGAAVALPLTTNQIVYAYAAGREQIIVRANGFTSGSAAVVLNATDGLPFVASAGGGGGGAVTAANPGDFVDGWDATQGLTTSAGITTDINGTAQGFRRGNIKMWLNYLARFPAALGSTTAAASLPVTLSTDGQFTTSTGSLTETAPATDIASSGLNGRLQRVAQRITSLIALLPTALGTTTAAGSLPVTLASDSTYATLQGGVTETAPATDTASSGANGRLQRVAQRLSSLIALLPTALVSNRLDVNLGAAPAIVTVQGGAAAGAAPVGNGVLLAGSDGANVQLLSTSNVAGSAALRVMIGNGSNGSTASLDLSGDADAVVTALPVTSKQQDWNGASWDRHRNNVDATLLASASHTTTQGPTTLTTYNAGAIVFVLDMTVAGSGSVTLTINEVDPASGKSILLLSGAAVTTNSTNVYTIDPIIASVANVSKNARTPRTLSWQVTANNANAATYSLGAMVEPT